MNKTKKKILTLILIILLVSFSLFLKVTKSNKLYSPDKQYSIYTKTYLYSEISCVLFSIFDCNYSGKIYLYDEVEKQLIGTLFTKNVSAIETVSWSTYNNSILFKDSETIIPEGVFVLPRPFKVK